MTALVLSASVGACGAGDDEQVPLAIAPDVILIIVDTWRWDALGANGAARPDLTPNLDRLASQGVRFARAITTSPWTEPSVASMLTGLYPTVHGAHGVLANVAPIRGGVPTLAELLAARGYRTLAVVNAFFLAPKLGFDRGFDIYDYYSSSNLDVRRAGACVDVALDHLRREGADRPAFLLLHLFDAHLAYDPPSPWRELWAAGAEAPFRDLLGMRLGIVDQSAEHVEGIRGLYDGEVAYVDRELGRLFAELETIRPGRERLIVVTSDHGEELGDHGGWEHGHSMYRELLQVPLLLVPPASRPASVGVVNAQVRLLDLMPTLLDAAGIERPEDLPGESLFAWFGESPRTDHLPAYSERIHLGAPAAALRDGEHVAIYWPEEGRLELYDQQADPLERVDLAPTHPVRASALRRRLAWMAGYLERRAGELSGDRKTVELTPKEIERLESLGYLSSPGQEFDDGFF